MTVPSERTRAVLDTKRFLLSLLDPKKTPRVPQAVRHAAGRLLRHYPWDFDLVRSAKKLPEVWGKVANDDQD